jgi:hypothetical protein
MVPSSGVATESRNPKTIFCMEHHPSFKGLICSLGLVYNIFLHDPLVVQILLGQKTTGNDGA